MSQAPNEWSRQPGADGATPHEALGLARGASADDIRRAYTRTTLNMAPSEIGNLVGDQNGPPPSKRMAVLVKARDSLLLATRGCSPVTPATLARDEVPPNALEDTRSA
jgi:hypothetical protein